MVQQAELGMVGERAAHTATTLEDGSVLVAGGCVVDGCATGAAETFVVAADGRSAIEGPAMAQRRDAHTATRVEDGRIVLIGGFSGEGKPPSDGVELFDPDDLKVMEAAELTIGRGGHAAALTGDGQVLIAGGWVGPRTYTPTVELFDPLSNAITRAGDLPWGADALDATALPDGRVLVTGGQTAPATGTDRAAVYDQGEGTWSEVDSMSTPRFKHMAVLLHDGRVLVIGGTTDDRQLLDTTEVFDPADGSFSPGPQLSEPRYKLPGGAVVLDDGRVLVAGGGRTVEVIDVEAGTADTVASFDDRGSFATANLLGSGNVVVIGGYDDAIDLRRAFAVIAQRTI